MKKIVLLFLVFALGTTFAFADDRDSDDSTNATPVTSFKNGYIGFGGGIDMPETNWYSDYGLGGGAQIFGGYRFDKSLAVQADVENLFIEGNIVSQYNLRMLAEVKYTLDVEKFQPYLLAGGGMIYSLTNPGADAAFNLDALGGAGLQFGISSDTDFYIEAKYNFILPATGSFQDIPLTAGIWTGF